MENARTETIISIDVGIKNLAICKMNAYYHAKNTEHGEDIENPSFKKTLLNCSYWDVVNVLEGTSLDNIPFNKIPIEQVIEPLVQTFSTRLFPRLIKEGDVIDTVVIEYQFNTTEMSKYAYVIQSLFYSYSLWNKEKCTIKNIKMQDARHKYKLFYLIPGVTKEMIRDHNASIIKTLKQRIGNIDKVKQYMDDIATTYNPYGDKHVDDFLGIGSEDIKKKQHTYKYSYKRDHFYDFNKKISSLMTSMFLIYHNMMDWHKWLMSLKKKDDASDAFNIAYIELIMSKVIVNAGTQLIVRTVPKMRRKRKTDQSKTSTSHSTPPTKRPNINV